MKYLELLELRELASIGMRCLKHEMKEGYDGSANEALVLRVFASLDALQAGIMANIAEKELSLSNVAPWPIDRYSKPHVCVWFENDDACQFCGASLSVRKQQQKEAEDKLKAVADGERKLLAAVIAGTILEASGYGPGRMIDETELAGDALAVADEILRQNLAIGGAKG